MLGRKTFTPDELHAARTANERQLTAYRRLVEAIDASGPDADVEAALASFEPLLFNGLTLALDRRFVHRLRGVTGKDANPLNEVELMTESLMNNDGILRAGKVIKLKPEQTVLNIEPGDRIALRSAQFERLSDAFLGEIASKFVFAAV